MIPALAVEMWWCKQHRLCHEKLRRMELTPPNNLVMPHIGYKIIETQIRVYTNNTPKKGLLIHQYTVYGFNIFSNKHTFMNTLCTKMPTCKAMTEAPMNGTETNDWKLVLHSKQNNKKGKMYGSAK